MIFTKPVQFPVHILAPPRLTLDQPRPRPRRRRPPYAKQVVPPPEPTPCPDEDYGMVNPEVSGDS